MQTTAIGTVANSLPENEVILLTLLISKGYILFAEFQNIFYKHLAMMVFNITGMPFPARYIIRPGCRQTHLAVLSD